MWNLKKFITNQLTNQEGDNMKHFAVKEELFNKVMEHLEEKEIRVFISAWVGKACEDLIKKEEKERDVQNN